MIARQALGATLVISCLLPGCATPGSDGWTPGAPPELLQLVPPGLRYVRVDLPPDQNAFTLWEKAIATFVPPDEPPELKAIWDDYRNNDSPFPDGEIGRLLGGYLDRNRGALERLVSAAQQVRWQSPPITNGILFIPSYLRSLKEFMNLKDVESRRNISRGLTRDSVLSFVDVLRIGDCVAEAEGGIVDLLVGRRLQETACEGILRIAAREDVPESTWKTVLTTLEERPLAVEAATQALRVDLCCLLLHDLGQPESFDAWGEKVGGLSKSPVFEKVVRSADKIGTVRILSAFYGRWIMNVQVSWPNRDKTLTHDIEWFVREVKEEMKRLESSPAIEVNSQLLPKALVALLGPAVEAFVLSGHRARAERAGTRLVVAIRLYAARKGRIPATLLDLVVEKILPAVPTDPFSGKPMRYSADRRIVWSVGPDEVDDGGVVEEEYRWAGKDYVWQVPVAVK
jgi:hypothetical protein